MNIEYSFFVGEHFKHHLEPMSSPSEKPKKRPIHVVNIINATHISFHTSTLFTVWLQLGSTLFFSHTHTHSQILTHQNVSLAFFWKYMCMWYSCASFLCQSCTWHFLEQFGWHVRNGNYQTYKVVNNAKEKAINKLKLSRIMRVREEMFLGSSYYGLC